MGKYMFIGEGAAKSAALGFLYAVIATPPFAVFQFEDISAVVVLLPMVAVCAVSAGALVGAVAVVTRAYRPWAAWRAQLAMVFIYALTGIVYLGWLLNARVSDALEAAVRFSPVFIPPALLATWISVRWIRTLPFAAGAGGK